MNRVAVKPEPLRWARERVGYSVDALTRRFPKIEAWERGEGHPTLKQIEAFAKTTHTPVGFLFEMLRRERARFVLGGVS
jgi:hypothetical protein